MRRWKGKSILVTARAVPMPEVEASAAEAYVDLEWKLRTVRPLSATALAAAVGDRRCFKNGRQFAAWLGLVPKQQSSGGRARLLGISKRGDSYLRTLLIHGARAVLARAGKKEDPRSRWVRKLRERRHPNIAA